MTYIEPLDLKEIFLVTLAGSTEIFAFLSFITIAFGSAYFRLPDKIFLIMIAMYAVFMSPYMGGIYLLVILIGGILTFWGLSKVFTR
jgi:hypothetical protein